jgi:hypothetical protein
MSDGNIIPRMSWAELTALMRETGMIETEGTGRVDGLPTIGASLKIVNAETGEKLPGGLPFSVVLFKDVHQAGYSSIAMVATVPAAELNPQMPPGFIDACNRRHRFVSVYALDKGSFIVQADMIIRGVTREHLKYGFGVWAAALSQILFDLVTAEAADIREPEPLGLHRALATAGGGGPSNIRPFVSRPAPGGKTRSLRQRAATVSKAARPKRQ